MVDKRRAEIVAAVACFALAAGLAVVAVTLQSEADAAPSLTRVEAQFSFASVRPATSRGEDGAARDDVETIVNAVYKIGGKTYRHSVKEADARRVAPTIPGKGVLLVDPRDPTRPPRIAPGRFVRGAPMLAALVSALLGITFVLAALRRKRDD